MPVVIFLRGVNVGGHRTFRPSVLAGKLNHLDLVNIGAAGTFIVRKSVRQTLVHSELRKHLPFETHIMMCASRELLAAVSHGPFDGIPIRANLVRFVAVLAKRPRDLPPLPFQIPREGKWFVRILSCNGRFVFGCYRREMKSIGYLGSMDKILGAPATVRNWNTITQILKVLEQS